MYSLAMFNFSLIYQCKEVAQCKLWTRQWNWSLSGRGGWRGGTIKTPLASIDQPRLTPDREMNSIWKYWSQSCLLQLRTLSHFHPQTCGHCYLHISVLLGLANHICKYWVQIMLWCIESYRPVETHKMFTIRATL